MLEQTLQEWQGVLDATRPSADADSDLWIFGYASLIWRPEFDFVEQRLARVHGYHRALKMWSRVNRGTPECPGLVFALLSGGSCQGMAFRIPRAQGEAALRQLWPREMPNPVYDPKWLRCKLDATGSLDSAPEKVITALAFTLSRRSPNFTGTLSLAQYQQIFSAACGRYGTTWDYAGLTLTHLKALGIHDRALERLLRHISNR